MPRSIPTAGAFAIFSGGLQGKRGRSHLVRGRDLLPQPRYILSRLVASSLGEKLGARSTYLFFKVAPKESKNSCGQTKRSLVRRFATLVTSPRPCPPIYRRAARRGSFWNVPSAQGRPPANRAPTRTEAGAAIGRAASTRATPPWSIERPWASLIDRACRVVAARGFQSFSRAVCRTISIYEFYVTAARRSIDRSAEMGGRARRDRLAHEVPVSAWKSRRAEHRGGRGRGRGAFSRE